MRTDNMKLGDTIKLIPITRHGKNRVQEQTIIRTSSFCVETPDNDCRWIDNVNDLNFNCEVIGE